MFVAFLGAWVLIPLYKRVSQKPITERVVGYVLVDDCDADELFRFRWRRSKKGYAYRPQARRMIWMHREIMGLPEIHLDPREVDHINLDKRDNRRANLRLVTSAQNSQNFPSHSGSTSRFRGVHWDPRRKLWRAEVYIGKKAVCRGRFNTELEAAAFAMAGRAKHLPFSREALALERA